MPISPQTHKPIPVRHKRHEATPRLKTAERGYGGRWQKTRKGYLRNHPLCAHCQDKGLVTAATEVDHITPHKGDQSLFWSRDNWQGLCKPCHSRKTASEDGGFGNWAGGGNQE